MCKNVWTLSRTQHAIVVLLFIALNLFALNSQFLCSGYLVLFLCSFVYYDVESLTSRLEYLHGRSDCKHVFNSLIKPFNSYLTMPISLTHSLTHWLFYCLFYQFLRHQLSHWILQPRPHILVLSIDILSENNLIFCPDLYNANVIRISYRPLDKVMAVIFLFVRLMDVNKCNYIIFLLSPFVSPQRVG